DEGLEFVMHALVRPREARHSRLVTNQDAAAGGMTWNRTRRRTPGAAGIIVAHVKRFAAAIDHRIVRKRREAVLAAVLGPGRGRSAVTEDGAEFRVRNDVHPRRRRVLIAVKDDRVGAAV